MRGLDTHKRLKHKEDHKRKLHDQGIKKFPSISRSPPTKKTRKTEVAKDNTTEGDIQNRNKDEKIKELETIIVELRVQLDIREESNKTKTEHKPEEQTEIPFEVVKRKKISTSGETLVENIRVETNKPNFSQMFNCEICNEISLTEELLNIHTETKHTELIKPVGDEMVCHMNCENGKCKCNETTPETKTCKICKKKFRNMEELKVHMKDEH